MRLPLKVSLTRPKPRLLHSTQKSLALAGEVKTHEPPIVTLRDAKIYERYPKSDGSLSGCIFPQLSFSLDSSPTSQERWAVISTDSGTVRTRFLQTLQGQYISVPSTARSWPYLSSEDYMEKNGGAPGEPSRKLRYVGFANVDTGSRNSGIQGAHLGARYESRREDTDWKLIDYLRGTVNLNLSGTEIAAARELEASLTFRQITEDLKLLELLQLPVGSLSNGQNRRARIAKALLEKPEVLLLDEPFAGLDPANREAMATLLERVAENSDPRVVLALHAQEAIPDWITHILELGSKGDVISCGDRVMVPGEQETLPTSGARIGKIGVGKYTFRDPELQKKLEERRLKGSRIIKSFKDWRIHKGLSEFDQKQLLWKRYPHFVAWDQYDGPHGPPEADEPLVEMSGVKVSYGSHCVLGNWQTDQDGQPQDGLHWTVRRGQRWGVFGANGSEKTTLISLLTSDHPQAYSLPIKIFGRSRLPSPSRPGISIFDLQARIGHSSPEVHTHFPRNFTIRQVIESAWAEAFHSRPKLVYENDEMVDSALRWFRHELDPSMATEQDPVEVAFGNVLTQRLYTDRSLRQGSKSRSNRIAWLFEEPTWAEQILFRECALSAQKVALFLRAVIKKPDIVVLDEAFSGMSKAARTKCMLWLADGEEKWVQKSVPNGGTVRPKRDTNMKKYGFLRNTGLEARQALICVSHKKEEVPFVVDRFLRLPEANEGEPVRSGPVDMKFTRDWWEKIWMQEL